MYYQKFEPKNEHSNIVECYFIWEGHSNGEITIESPPNAFSSIVFNYNNPYKISTVKYERKDVPQSFICGQAIRNYTLHLEGKIGMAGIVFKPAGIFHILGLPMYEFTGERLPLEKCVPHHYLQYEDLIKSASTNQEKVRLLEYFVEDLIPSEYYGSEEILYASNEIVRSKGNINVEALCKEVCMSRRNFERRFLEEVGVSPKSYARLRRFGYTCSLMAGKRKMKLSDVFYRTGYYDQSHFIRDFKYFAGRSPRLYMKSNVELANYVRDALMPKQES